MAIPLEQGFRGSPIPLCAYITLDSHNVYDDQNQCMT